MQKIMAIAALFCLLYFLFLWSRKTDFCGIWLLAAAVFAAAGGYLFYRAQYLVKLQMPKWVQIGMTVPVVLGVLIFLIVEGCILSTMLSKPEPGIEKILVLGAQVRGRNPSRALLRRMETAEQYLKENPQTIAVLSGGQGDGEDITEAQCMYEYLTQYGIDPERLRKEERSTSTRENLIFSGVFLGEKEKRIGIVSNNFHLYRAKRLAQKLGYQNVDTIAASSDWKFQLHYLVREFFALVKEQIKGNI